MEYEIVELNEKTVAGLMKKTTNERGQSVVDCGLLWQAFFEKGFYQQIEGKISHKTIGLYTEYEGDFTKPYQFLVCCEVNKEQDFNPPFIKRKIEGGRYAKFIVKGNSQTTVGAFWNEFWNSGCMQLDRKYASDFEEYQNDFQDTNQQEVHIYISIK